MNTEDDPRRKKKAYLKRADVYAQDLDTAGESAGECWMAVDDDGQLITVGSDIAPVTQAVRAAGYWVS